MPRLSALISLLALVLLSAAASAQTMFPEKQGQKARYAAMIEMPKAYVSGVCVMMNDGGLVKGSLFNEFGLSALDFSYNTETQKIKLYNVMSRLNKWYVKRQLRKDLLRLFQQLREGGCEYRNERQRITYKFTPLNDDTEK